MIKTRAIFLAWKVPWFNRSRNERRARQRTIGPMVYRQTPFARATNPPANVVAGFVLRRSLAAK
jgi:hypothetical protein